MALQACRHAVIIVSPDEAQCIVISAPRRLKRLPIAPDSEFQSSNPGRLGISAPISGLALLEKVQPLQKVETGISSSRFFLFVGLSLQTTETWVWGSGNESAPLGWDPNMPHFTSAIFPSAHQYFCSRRTESRCDDLTMHLRTGGLLMKR